MGGKGEVRKRTGNGYALGLVGGEVPSQGTGPLLGLRSCLRHVTSISRAGIPVSEVLRHSMALPVVSKGKVKISNPNGFQVS